MRRARESTSIKDCWEISKFNCVGFSLSVVLVIVGCIKMDLGNVILSFWLMNIFMDNVIDKIDDIKFKELQDRIEELENKQ